MQRQTLGFRLVAFLALCALAAPAAEAATVRQMNLEQLCDNGALIVRGKVLGAKEGTVAAGGGQIPTVTYRIEVEETFKGAVQEVKGLQVAEITMLGKLRPAEGSASRLAADLVDVPRLEVGRDYLLIATAPSAIGLSTTVGLGQGAFRVTGKAGQEIATNLVNNLGLLLGMESSATGAATTGVRAASEEAGGPLPYSFLAGLIRDLVSE